ncbi:MAG: hypothetical protein ACPLZ9_07065, partial [Candidatus Ratteibacteria bacterium]
MDYVVIKNKKFVLNKYLTEEELSFLRENVLPRLYIMRTERTIGGIVIKSLYIGKFHTNARRENKSQIYLCRNKIGYYLSLDHGYAKPGLYGKAKVKNGQIIYNEGYKDVPELENYIDYFMNSENSQFDK